MLSVASSNLTLTAGCVCMLVAPLWCDLVCCCRNRQHNPAAVVKGDTLEQVAVWPILSKTQVNQLLQLC